MDQASSLRKIIGLNKAGKGKKMSGQKRSDSPRVMAITSGKGGVGKTNIVGNLAVAFAERGKKVLIIDADLGLANIDIIFGLRPEYSIKHVIKGEKELSEVIVKVGENISIIPGGSGFSDLSQLTEGEKLHLLSEFELLNESLDYVLIDTGAGISSNVLYFNLAADECYIVATHEPTSITDAYAMMKVMSTQHGAKRFKLIANMVENETEAKAVYSSLSQAIDRFLTGVVLEFMGYIPSDRKLKQSVINRKTVVSLFPEAMVSKKIHSLCDAIMQSPRNYESDGNIKFFLKQVMEFEKN